MQDEKPRIKRLFFDLEVSPNIVYSWNIGRKISIDYNSILQERAIICACYKWEGDKTVSYLTWNNGNDKQLAIELAKIMNTATEIIGHNGDAFDIKWLRTRCLFHNVLLKSKFTSVDTLKASRKYFRFNSNRLDYIGKYLGLGKKIHTSFDLWKNIVSNNSEAAKSMQKMVKYCKMDVILLESIFNKLYNFIDPTTHLGALYHNDRCSCPKCASKEYKLNGTRYTASGLRKKELQCKSCGSYYRVSESLLIKK